MHSVFLRFYEELNDFLPTDKKKIRFEHNFPDRTSIKDLIESIGVPHSEIDLLLVNGKSVDFAYMPNDNDDISVYPMFESFDISDVTSLRAKPLRDPKFVLDVHLGKLARYLRMLGIDSAYKNNFSKEEIISVSLNEHRTILTKDRNILKRNEITHGYWIRNENIMEQVKEVINRFHLEKELRQFSRCMECNSLLEKVDKEEVINALPEKVKAQHKEFIKCPGCGRIYWKGTHYEKMKKLIFNLIDLR